MNPRRETVKKIAVIGGGWAGLSAAAALRAAAYQVTVFEAGRTPGGRARRVPRDGRAAPLDNGQHILLGAYTETLALMRRLGLPPEQRLRREPLRLESADGRLRIAAPRLPAPLHAVCALLFARGLSLHARLAAVRLIRQLRVARWRVAPEQTVSQLLDQHGQPPALRDQLWTPLCLATLNTPPQQASAALFAAVLRDSLSRTRAASDLLLPTTDLSDLWPDTVARHVDWRAGHRVRALDVASAPSSGYTVDGERFDALILAVPPHAAAPLLAMLPDHPGKSSLLDTLDTFTYLPIATVTLTLTARWRLPAAMLMLCEDATRGHLGQWLFDRAALTGCTDAGELAVVISAADALPEREALLRGVEAQVREQTRRKGRPAMPAVAHASLITEKRATFAALPALPRPGVHTPWPGLVLAGDWTDTGYPGVLEGAVRSGLMAARRLQATTLRGSPCHAASILSTN